MASLTIKNIIKQKKSKNSIETRPRSAIFAPIGILSFFRSIKRIWKTKKAIFIPSVLIMQSLCHYLNFLVVEYTNLRMKSIIYTTQTRELTTIRIDNGEYLRKSKEKTNPNAPRNFSKKWKALHEWFVITIYKRLIPLPYETIKEYFQLPDCSRIAALIRRKSIVSSRRPDHSFQLVG